MKLLRTALPAILCAGLCALPPLARGEEANPLQKVVQLLGGLQQKVISEGETAQKIYNEVSEACEDRSRELHFEIKTGKAQTEELKAVIDEKSAKGLSLTSKVEDMAAATAEDEAELKAATALRKKEASTFSAAEKELMEMLDSLKRATGSVERQGSSFVQSAGTKNLVQVLDAMVQASAVSSADASRLTALVQSSSADADGDEAEDADGQGQGQGQPGAPAADEYESKSGAVADALEGLTEKTEDQLDALRKEETQELNNYALKKQALEDQIKFVGKDMASAKKGLAAAEEKKAGAEGELTSTSEDLKEDIKVLGELHHDCMEQAATFEEQTKSRGEELKALAEAKKAIVELTGGAESQTSGLVQESSSFIQLKARATAKSKSGGAAGLRAVHLVRRLAMGSRSAALAQLASRMGAALRATSKAANSEDPFAKVKGLITDMIDKLEDAAGEDAKKKAWCDKETKETGAKKGDKEDGIESLGTKVEQMSAASVKLKEEVAVLNNELGALRKAQAEADGLRSEEKAEYNKVRPELERSIEGVKTALKVLKEYYAKDDSAAHDADAGGASGIIGLLEVCESNFSKQLAEVVAEEERAVQEHTQLTNENEVAKAKKEADVKYKTKEATSLDKSVTEGQGDLSSINEEYAAIMEYWNQIKKACTAKAEPYEERVKARAKEIEGLKQAIDILEGEASLVQRHVTHRTLRGGGHLLPSP